MLSATLVALAMTGGYGAAPATEESIRVGGDLRVEAERRVGPEGEVTWHSGSSFIDTPLPEGYPAPTPPGALELKRYPEVRRAEATGGSSMGFWKLFMHIKRRDIAMTAPVEIDYEGLTADDSARPEGSRMAFLYREKDLGPTGEDGSVSVRDAEPMTVLSLGVRGPNDWRGAARGLRVLEDWLAGQDEWEAAGEPRTLHYNGPSVRPANRWMEVQVPVRPLSS